MSQIIQANGVSLPAPRVEGNDIRIRPGIASDLPSIDALQKKHGKQLGFMNRTALEGKIAAGHVLVAEVASGRLPVASGQFAVGSGRVETSATDSSFGPHPSSLRPAGYLIGNDRYRHRDELGVIFQMCIAPEYRRSLVAANLLKAQFERSAYGCRLYCCWCAQDLPANRFWESMGFVPIAFRAGSEKRNRVHIFWQRRIRAGDTQTPWWFPSETSGGMMDASRIALPIPPGMHWSDELPRLIPTAADSSSIETGSAGPERSKRTKPAKRESSAPRVPQAIIGIRSGGMRLTPEVPVPATKTDTVVSVPADVPMDQAKPSRRGKKASPELAAKARECRDRWIEAASRGEWAVLPVAKYEIGCVRGGDQGSTLGPVQGGVALPCIEPHRDRFAA